MGPLSDKTIIILMIIATILIVLIETWGYSTNWWKNPTLLPYFFYPSQNK